MTDLQKAWRLLQEEGHTCVLCRGEQVYYSDARGVKPLLCWYEQGLDLSGYSAADKVVGRGAAFLYILLGVARVHSVVMSQEAAQVLQSAGIEISFEENPARILNRERSGFCPIETAVLGISDPRQALDAIRKKLMQLKG